LCNEITENEVVQREGVVLKETGGSMYAGADAASSEEGARVFEARERLTGRFGRSPTTAELAGELSLDEDKVSEILLRASPRQREASAAGTWGPIAPNFAPIPVALRIVQRQLSELSERLAALVERVERREGP